MAATNIPVLYTLAIRLANHTLLIQSIRNIFHFEFQLSKTFYTTDHVIVDFLRLFTAERMIHIRIHIVRCRCLYISVKTSKRHMEKFEGADNLAADMNFGEELVDLDNAEAGL